MRGVVLAVVAGVVGSAVGRPAELVVWDPRDVLPSSAHISFGGVSGVAMLPAGPTVFGRWFPDFLGETVMPYVAPLDGSGPARVVEFSFPVEGLPSFFAGHRVLSDDGRFLALYLAATPQTGPLFFSELVRWDTVEGRVERLGDLMDTPYPQSVGGVISADGSVVVGASVSPLGVEVVRWTADTGMVGLGTLVKGLDVTVKMPFLLGLPLTTNPDASVIMGALPGLGFGGKAPAQSSAADSYRAFVWDADDGLRPVPELGGDGISGSYPLALSRSGRSYAGTVEPTDARPKGFIFTPSDGLVTVGETGGTLDDVTLLWVNEEGVSFGLGDLRDDNVPFFVSIVAEPSGRASRLADRLRAQGVVLGSLSVDIPGATDASDDLRTVVGTGSLDQADDYQSVAWMVTLPLPITACNLADHAEPRGSLTFADVSAFLNAFVAQEPSADIVVPADEWTFADVNAFLQAFVAGCP